jgi:hypothetical protein
VKPERLLIPLVAIAVAVFATSRLMVAIDPGEAHPTGLPHDTAESLKDEVRRAIGSDRKGGGNRSRETYSFYSPSGMRQLRRLIEREGGRDGRIPIFRIQSDQAQVQVARGRGGKLLVIDRGPTVKFSTSTPVASPYGFRLSQLDVQAPRRILTAVARLSKASAKDVDYMVCTLNPIDGTVAWDAFLTVTATHFHADAHGRHVTRP